MLDPTRSLLELCQRHSDILDQKDVYGEGDPQSQARRYWLEHLAAPIIGRARASLDAAGRLPKVDLLISVAGLTPETTIITAGVFQPREVLIVTSDELHENIDIIGKYLSDNHGIRHSQFRHEGCNTGDMSLFEIICHRVRAHRQKRSRSNATESMGETLVDITGGKKVMSAGAAMAALELDLRICYVNNEFDKRRRTAVPGTEDIVLLDSPFRQYGTAEQRRADQDFDLGAYDVARSRYEQLAEKLNEPARARFFRDISAFYEAWRNLDIDGLKTAMSKVQEHLDVPLARPYRERLEAQIRFVERLVEEDRPTRVMTLFLLADANFSQKRYDFSALLFYRTIEASIASRLEQRFPGFSCEKPDYALIDPDIEALRQRFDAARKEIFSKSEERVELPSPIACLDGALVLRAEKDDLMSHAGFERPKALSSFPGLIKARNLSILAHGYRSVTENDCKKLRDPAERFLDAYWALNHEPVPFKQAIEQLRFIKVGTP